MDDEFSNLFGQLYEGYHPFPYQKRFAQALISESPPNCVAVSTGAGKEAAIIAGFVYQLQVIGRWRRLVYTLPTRSLVSQVETNTRKAVNQAQLETEVYSLMGGAVERDWTNAPERSAILIGTQDQLLSRALNRGYSQSPYQWLIDFGFLSNDCLWAFDEVQLMQAGLRTSIQLQGLRDRFGSFHPTHSIWLSATLDQSSLQSIDYQQPLEAIALNDEDYEHSILKSRLTAQKALQKWDGGNQPVDIANLAQQQHEPGTKTLIVVNQVPRAQEISRHLAETELPVLLVHSQFRPTERPTVEDLKAFDGIIVTTQAIEAGVDLSARLLITDLCPWSSFVQRCGRCNRQGALSNAKVIWVDLADSNSLPYFENQLQQCRKVLETLPNADIPTLTKIDIPPDIEATPVPRATDVLELFHTDEDLQGSRVDVGAFVRGSEDTNVGLAWRDFEQTPSLERGALRREELCQVSIGRARRFLKNHSGWIWNWTKRSWEETKRFVPGMSILLPTSAGGYSSNFGFTGKQKDTPEDLHLDEIPHESNQDDNRSFSEQWVELSQHSNDIVRECQNLCQLVPEHLQDSLMRASRWHDYGKAHPHWQGTIPRTDKQIYAKIPRYEKWNGPSRRGFRHELASMLVARQYGESPLVQYLILCHHGKVRTVIDAWSSEEAPSDDRAFARGVWEGDPIDEEVDLGGDFIVKPQTLSLSSVVSCLGEWVEETNELLETYGPYRLAYLEALVRVADWRASANPGGNDAT